jgi:4a-hydroxytetrahydrobiopterin dehydratase
MSALSHEALAQALLTVPEWEVKNGELRRTFNFTDFRESMSFVNLVAALAERAGHHPDIDIRYNKVLLSLVTHDEGGISEKDFALARDITGVL